MSKNTADGFLGRGCLFKAPVKRKRNPNRTFRPAGFVPPCPAFTPRIPFQGTEGFKEARPQPSTEKNTAFGSLTADFHRASLLPTCR